MEDNGLLGFTEQAPAPDAQMVFTPAAPDMGADMMMGGASRGYVDPFQGVPVKDNTGDYGSGIPEVTALREWEDNHAKDLEEKSRKEEGEKKARREAAYAEIQKWKDERDSNIVKKRSTNRQDEEATGAAAQSVPESENRWERVVDLIDTNARSSDDSRDTSRMRALLIQLKGSPPETGAKLEG